MTTSEKNGAIKYADAIVAAATSADAPLAALLGGSDEWEAHLRGVPEGRLALTAHYNTGTGDVLTSLARRDGSLLAAHLSVPDWPENQHRFILFAGQIARAVNVHECLHAIRRANHNCPQAWSYPAAPDGRILPGRYIALEPEHVPAFQEMRDTHDWFTPAEDGSLTCADCGALLQQEDGRAVIRLPLRRRAHYLLQDGAMAAVTDEAFYGAPTLRISQAGPERRTRRSPIRREPVQQEAVKQEAVQQEAVQREAREEPAAGGRTDRELQPTG